MDKIEDKKIRKQDMMVKDRTGQIRWDRTGQDWASGQDRKRQDKIKWDRTGQEETGQDSIGEDRTGKGMAR